MYDGSNSYDNQQIKVFEIMVTILIPYSLDSDVHNICRVIQVMVTDLRIIILMEQIWIVVNLVMQ